MNLNTFEHLAKKTLSRDREEVNVHEIMQGVQNRRRRRRFLLILPFIFAIIAAGGYFVMQMDAPINAALHRMVMEDAISIPETDQNSIEIQNNPNAGSQADVQSGELTGDQEEANTTLLLNTQMAATTEQDRTTMTSSVPSSATATIQTQHDLRFKGEIQHSKSLRDLITETGEQEMTLQEPTHTPASQQQTAGISSTRRQDLSLNMLPTYKNTLSSDDGTTEIQFPEPGMQTLSVRNPWTLTLAIDGGMLLPSKTLTAVAQGENAILDLRQTSEKSLAGVGLAAALRVSRTTLPFFIRLGTGYAVFQEQMHVDEQTTTQDTIQGLIAVTTNSSGDTVNRFYGDVVREVNYSRSGNVYYRVSTFDVPVSIGYQAQWRQWTASLEAGMRFNLLAFFDGRILGPDNAFIDVDDPGSFRESIGTGYFGKVTIGRVINHRLQATLSTAFRHYPQNIATAGQEFEQRYNLWNLFVGMEYRL